MRLDPPIRTLLLTLLFALATSTTAAAQITPADADFDSLPTGPYFDVLLSGSPTDMNVRNVANVLTIFPNVVPPGAAGNLLRVDNSTSPSNDDVILRFAYGCDGSDSEAACRLSFGFVGWTFTDGRGVKFYVDDDGSYTSPAASWIGSVTGGAIDDGTVEAVSIDAPNCTTTHILDVVVEGGALFMVDGVLAECLAPVADETIDFGTLKSRFE